MLLEVPVGRYRCFPARPDGALANPDTARHRKWGPVPHDAPLPECESHGSTGCARARGGAHSRHRLLVWSTTGYDMVKNKQDGCTRAAFTPGAASTLATLGHRTASCLHTAQVSEIPQRSSSPVGAGG